MKKNIFLGWVPTVLLQHFKIRMLYKHNTVVRCSPEKTFISSPVLRECLFQGGAFIQNGWFFNNSRTYETLTRVEGL